MESAESLITMRLEGKVIGPWVEECNRTWEAIRGELGFKKLRIDLCELAFVDENGMALLREIYRISGAEVLADSPLTKYFAERIVRKADESENGGG